MPSFFKKILFLSGVVFCFSFPAYAQSVSTQAEIANIINANETSHIVLSTSIAFTYDMPAYSTKTVSIVSNYTDSAINGQGYEGFKFFTRSDISFENTASSNTVIHSFVSASSGGVINISSYSSLNLTWMRFDNNSAVNGGGVFLTTSTMDAFNFNGYMNSAVENGGVIYAQNSTTTLRSGGSYNGSTDNYFAFFSSNTAGMNGGVLYATNTFVDADNIYFLFNEAQNGGAVYIDSGTFVISKSSFAGNVAHGNGGAIYMFNISSNSYMFDNEFMVNDAANGIVYVSSSNGVRFNNIYFSSNTVGSGTLYMSASSATLTDVYFSSNIASSSGAAGYFDNSVVTFNNVDLRGNEADVAAGFYVENSTAIINNAYFTSNKAVLNAGGIYGNNSVISIEYTDFANNFSSASAGGIYSDNSRLSVKRGTFSGNISRLSGGAAYINKGSADIADSVFSGNMAQDGGAFYVDSADVTISGGSFSGNTASSNGGALYITGASASEKASVTLIASHGDLVFSGNTAGAAPNDVYLNDNAVLNLQADKGSIIFYGGIRDNVAGTNTINKNGSYNLILGGLNSINSTVNLNGGGIRMLENSALTMKNLSVGSGAGLYLTKDTTTNITNTLAIAQGAVLSTDRITSFNAATLNLDGDLKIGVDTKSGTSDTITGTTVNLGAASSITMNGNLSAGSSTFTVIQAASLTGDFAVTSGEYGARTAWRTDKVGNNMNLVLNVISYDELEGFTENEQSMADVIAAVYDSAYDADGTLWNNVISPMDALSMKDLKKTLTMLSGSFYADLLTLTSLNSERNNYFEKIELRNESDNGWVQLTGNMVTIKKDENSSADMEDINFGARVGWDIYNQEDKIAGIMLGYAYHDVSQDKDSATINDASLGAYAGVFKESYEFKGILTLGLQSYDATRDITTISQKAEGSFMGYGAAFAAQAAYLIGLSDAVLLRPFIGADVSFLGNEDFTETGKGAELYVDSQNYIRSNALIGLGLKGYHNRIMWYLDAGAGYLITGSQNEIDVRLNQTEEVKTIKGIEQGEISANAGFGLEISLSEIMTLYVDTGYTGADRYENIYANLGLRYKIGGF